MKGQENNTFSKYRSKIRWGTFTMLALLCVSAMYVMPDKFTKVTNFLDQNLGISVFDAEKEFKLGLDLQGGAHLVYGTDLSQIESGEEASAVNGARDVIERRVNGLGVADANVQATLVGDDHRIIVELPGVKEVDEAIALIGETPVLEFKEQNTEPPRELTEEEQAQMEEANKAEAEKASEVGTKLSEGADFAEIAREYSDDEYTKENGGYLDFVGEDILDEESLAWVSAASEGDVMIDARETEFGYTFFKKGATRDGEMEVEASHILICHNEAMADCAEERTKEEAFALAEELFEKANAENFADLAKEYSADPGSKDNGGALGSFPKGVMLPNFEEAAFGAGVGEITTPIETDFGYHVIYKTGEKAPKQYELSRVFVKKTTKTDIIPALEAWVNTGLSGKQLERTSVVTNGQTGGYEVSLQFDAEGRELFADITGRNIGKPVGIFLDGYPISQPTVNQAITAGEAVIQGNFSVLEAQELSKNLNAGALPVPIHLVTEQTIGATLGAESLSKSLYAGVLAILVVMVFMFLYYRLPGFLSVIALALYIFLTLSIYKLTGITLTLSGIAGMILSVGMAVDANVLIFERVKEELKEGKSLKPAIEEGFLRAWPSIRDGNISTLITAFILMGFGSNFVKGFALTLTIGILVSLFSAITVSRTFLRFVEPWFGSKCKWMFLGSPKKDK